MPMWMSRQEATEKIARARCASLGIDPDAIVGKVPVWRAMIHDTDYELLDALYALGLLDAKPPRFITTDGALTAEQAAELRRKFGAA
jgi:hypothetical protein